MGTHRTEDTWLSVQEAVLDVAAAVAFLQTPRAGGIDVFLGTTRQWTGTAETVYLAYEAYVPMALRVMERLVETARQQGPVLKAVLWHRLGVVPVAEASVLVGVATPHRAEAFAACRYLIDALKQEVPIWKREHYADGRTAWVEGRPSPG
jgi:molybdopterin synthase catalytic subunit